MSELDNYTKDIEQNVQTQTSTDSQINPLLQKLTPQQFEASVHFYEADRNLNHEDRVDLANDLGKVATQMVVTRMSLGTLAFASPTIYYKYYVKTKLPLLVHKPFLSVFLGLSTMIGVNELLGNYEFEQKRRQVQSRSIRQYDVWKAMDYHQTSFFYLYYIKSSQDESYILKDPRKFTEKSLHEVHYKPKHQQINSNSSTDNASEHKTTHWDQIRAANGFGPKNS